jgi:hypothetical protein
MIRAFMVGRMGEVTQGRDTLSGLFLTDIEANEDGVFAATIAFDTSVTPAVAKDQIRVYRIDDGHADPGRQCLHRYDPASSSAQLQAGLDRSGAAPQRPPRDRLGSSTAAACAR